jgi:hypothetical protein
MLITKILVSAAITVGCFVGGAAPANAHAPSTDGAYRYLEGDGSAGTWIIRTACTPRCAAYVTTSPSYGFTAPLTNGKYTVTRTVPDGVTCPPYYVGDTPLGSSTYSVVVHQWWDPGTRTGGVDYLQSPAPCGIPIAHDTFTLTRIG